MTNININAPLPSPLQPNPYNYPVIVEVEFVEHDEGASEFHEFSDLQQAWMWARDQTQVHDFPFNEQPYGDHAGWDFMSFLFLKGELEAHPDQEFEVFSKQGEKNFIIYYKDDEVDEDEDEDEDLPPAGVPPPGGSPLDEIAPASQHLMPPLASPPVEINYNIGSLY